MKIKQKRQVNLTQLINWAWWNGAVGKFKAMNGVTSIVFMDGGLVNLQASEGYLNKEVLFEIEEEVTIDEDTVFKKYIVVNDKGEVFSKRQDSINERLRSKGHSRHGTKFIYLQNDDSSIGELIWKDGEMVE